MKADRRGRQIDLLIEVLFQIDDAVGSEAVDRLTALRIERDERVSRRDVEDPLLAAVGQ
jgi:hypothetical protein